MRQSAPKVARRGRSCYIIAISFSEARKISSRRSIEAKVFLLGKKGMASTIRPTSDRWIKASADDGAWYNLVLLSTHDGRDARCSSLDVTRGYSRSKTYVMHSTPTQQWTNGHAVGHFYYELVRSKPPRPWSAAHRHVPQPNNGPWEWRCMADKSPKRWV